MWLGLTIDGQSRFNRFTHVSEKLYSITVIHSSPRYCNSSRCEICGLLKQGCVLEKTKRPSGLRVCSGRAGVVGYRPYRKAPYCTGRRRMFLDPTRAGPVHSWHPSRDMLCDPHTPWSAPRQTESSPPQSPGPPLLPKVGQPSQCEPISTRHIQGCFAFSHPEQSLSGQPNQDLHKPISFAHFIVPESRVGIPRITCLLVRLL